MKYGVGPEQVLNLCSCKYTGPVRTPGGTESQEHDMRMVTIIGGNYVSSARGRDLCESNLRMTVSLYDKSLGPAQLIGVIIEARVRTTITAPG